jgi:hypothetical protein
MPKNDEQRNALIEECAKCIPTTWLDPLLSGPESIVPPDGFNDRSVEMLLKALAAFAR